MNFHSKTKAILSIFLVLTLALGCQKKDDPKPEDSSPKPADSDSGDNSGGSSNGTPSAPKDGDQAGSSPSTPGFSLANEFTVACEAGLKCHSSVGVLFKKADQKSYACTVFVAGEIEGKSVVATTKSCVEIGSKTPEQLKDKDLEQFAIVFPQTDSFPKDSAGVVNVLNRSPGEFSDYAFLQLDRKLGRPPFKLSQQGLDYSTSITMHYADVISKHEIRLGSINCSTNSGPTVFVTGYLHPQSPSIGLYGCALKPGNNGSPIVNSKGEVAAIAQLGPKEGAPSSESKEDSLAIDQFDINRVGVATNLACVDFSALSLHLPLDPSVCNPTQKPDIEAVVPNPLRPEDDVELMRKAMSALVELARADKSGIFAWKMQVSLNRQKFSTLLPAPSTILEAVPECAFRRDDPASKIETYNHKLLILDHFDGTGVIHINQPIAFSHFDLDKEGRVTLGWDQAYRITDFEFDPGQIAGLGDDRKTDVTEKSGDSSETLAVGACSLNYSSVYFAQIDEADRLAKHGTDEEVRAHFHP